MKRTAMSVLPHLDLKANARVVSAVTAYGLKDPAPEVRSTAVEVLAKIANMDDQDLIAKVYSLLSDEMKDIGPLIVQMLPKIATNTKIVFEPFQQ